MGRRKPRKWKGKGSRKVKISLIDTTPHQAIVHRRSMMNMTSRLLGRNYSDIGHSLGNSLRLYLWILILVRNIDVVMFPSCLLPVAGIFTQQPLAADGNLVHKPSYKTF